MPTMVSNLSILNFIWKACAQTQWIVILLLKGQSLKKPAIVIFQWQSPVAILQEHHRQQSWLAPPQIYELSRLCRFADISELAKFAEQREQIGMARWLPVRMNCTDGMITALPGWVFRTRSA